MFYTFNKTNYKALNWCLKHHKHAVRVGHNHGNNNRAQVHCYGNMARRLLAADSYMRTLDLACLTFTVGHGVGAGLEQVNDEARAFWAKQLV